MIYEQYWQLTGEMGYLVANWANLSIREITMFLTLTAGWSSAHASRKFVRDERWNSSGKTWIIHSIKYS